MSEHVLVIGKVWPEPSSSAAGRRMLQLIHIFLSKNWKVSFASAANKSEHAFNLDALNIEQFSIELNNNSFDLFVKTLQPSLILFDRFTTEEQFGWRVAEQCPDALRLLDTEDLHCLRAARQLAFKEQRAFEYNDLASDIAKREIASIYRCDLSLIISETEMEILRSFFKVDDHLLHYLPFLAEAPDEETTNSLPQFSDRSGFISIGNFLHEPNWDAVLFLKQEIWPLIRKELPKAELHVYGAYPSQKVFALHNAKEGFLVKGRANDVNEVMRHARVCLAPLRFGAGLKGKLLDAMLNGTPSVTTDIGAESMHGNLPWPGDIKNSAAEISAAAIKLYTEEATWEKAQQHAYAILKACYAPQKHSATLLTAIADIKHNLFQHRLHNFTGSMLMHHHALSTRYMALWIEAKNKK